MSRIARSPWANDPEVRGQVARSLDELEAYRARLARLPGGDEYFASYDRVMFRDAVRPLWRVALDALLLRGDS